MTCLLSLRTNLHAAICCDVRIALFTQIVPDTHEATFLRTAMNNLKRTP